MGEEEEEMREGGERRRGQKEGRGIFPRARRRSAQNTSGSRD